MIFHGCPAALEQRSGGFGTMFRRPWNEISWRFTDKTRHGFPITQRLLGKTQCVMNKTLCLLLISRHFSICLIAGGLGTTTRAYAMIVISTFLLALLAPLAPSTEAGGCKRCKKCNMFPVYNNHSTQKKGDYSIFDALTTEHISCSSPLAPCPC